MKTQENKIITEGKGTQVAPKLTPAEKEAAKQNENAGNADPSGAPPPMEMLKKGKPAEEGAPASEPSADTDLNKENSEEKNNDPSRLREGGNPDNTGYGRGL